MHSQQASVPEPTDPGWLPHGGEMGALIRATQWSKTSFGPLADWPHSLRFALGICLDSRFPMVIYWGPDYLLLYNDAWRPVVGNKHPWSFGRSAREVWSEIWDIIGPMFEQVMRGEATWSDDQLLPLHRYGYTEECYFYYSFSPIRGGDGRVEGIFTAVTETTYRVLDDRRTRMLRELSAHTVQAKSDEEVCVLAAEILATNVKDLPFALLYLMDAKGRSARLVGTSGIEPGTLVSPGVIDLNGAAGIWPFAHVLQTGKGEQVVDLTDRLGALRLGPWPEAPHMALVLPILTAGQANVVGLFVAGISARLTLDDDYQGFLEMVVRHIGMAVANARAYEAERKRAEVLAELDRAKTAFFSNVSHEFRTPLTLMLGPVEDILARPASDLLPEDRERLTIVHRNGQRLLKLVNTLLDFVRIGAGRVQVVYEPTDLAALTAELASNFRSACEQAGLELVVDCPLLREPVYVDRDMWEKIVLNLLSNAFKFTFKGEIEVRLRQSGEAVELVVRDTGTGISAEEMPHLFERFYRVQGAHGRTHEGTGIGLALVQELVKLHGGSVQVVSVYGEGSTFTVTLPTGQTHLPADRIRGARTLAATSLEVDTFVNEALRWLPDPEPVDQAGERSPFWGLSAVQPEEGTGAPGRPRIVLADDNADMRDYVRRLLGRQYEVAVFPDGEQALSAVQADPPDLILSDVMMPALDGFGLLQAVREDPRTRTLPVILLSARAGEEARVEGLEARADDYLTKPFSARELLARVGVHLELARVRRESEAALRDADRRKDEFLATLAHELRNPLAPIRNALQIMHLAGHNGQAVEQARAVMERQLGQMIRLIDDLLDVSRITRDKLELRMAQVELAAVVRSAVEASRPLIEASGHELTVGLPPGPIYLHADPTRLAQVVSNLLNNSAKYTERGGRIWLAVEQHERTITLKVKDTGIGIPTEMLPKIFEMFAQVDRSLERSQGGLGIGLTLVRRLTEMHGGSVKVYSAGPGQGSEFTVVLPLALE